MSSKSTKYQILTHFNYQGRDSPSKGLYMKRIEKGGRSLPTPRLFELVFRLIDIILCINNLLTLLLLTIVKPFLSTNKQLQLNLQ